MESILLAINPRDPLWIAIAFLCGFAMRLFGLPPLIGFLIAGFGLHAAGAEGGQFLAETADLGVTLLLFTIGLKLRLSSLARPEVWAVSFVHMGVVTLLLASFVKLLAVTGIPMLTSLDWQTALLIGFALSFSSTVFAVKILDQLGASQSRHGVTAIGVLIVQDVAAVAFLAFSAGKIPTIWALGLLALIPARYLLMRILTHAGHGELLVLYGIVLALGGADLFELVGMKGDLGALVAGILLSAHPKAREMAKVLLSFKDLFLVGFFLSIGMTALPGWTEVLVALMLIVFLPLKVALYFGLFLKFRLRASTAWRSSLNLANYSEFGLIVGALSYAAGWLPRDWLAVFAIALSLSFILAAPMITVRDNVYARWRMAFKRFEHPRRLSGEEDLHLNNVRIVIFGMGRIGTNVYRAMAQEHPSYVLGVDIDESVVKRHQGRQREVVAGDGSNPDFWTRAPNLSQQAEWMILALPSHEANVAVARLLKEQNFQGRIAAIARFPEEMQELKKQGVDFVFDIYTIAGIGFADDLRNQFGAEGAPWQAKA